MDVSSSNNGTYELGSEKEQLSSISGQPVSVNYLYKETTIRFLQRKMMWNINTSDNKKCANMQKDFIYFAINFDFS